MDFVEDIVHLVEEDTAHFVEEDTAHFVVERIVEDIGYIVDFVVGIDCIVDLIVLH